MRSLEGGGRGRAEMGYLVSEVIQARFRDMLDPVGPLTVSLVTMPLRVGYGMRSRLSF